MGDPHQESIAFDSRTIQRLPQCGNVAEYGHNGCPMSGGRDISGVWANQERSGGGSNLNHTLHWKRDAWGRRNRVFYLERFSWCPVPGSFPGIFRMSVPDVSFGRLFLRPAVTERKHHQPGTRPGRDSISRWGMLSALGGSITGLGRKYHRPWTRPGRKCVGVGPECHRPWTEILPAKVVGRRRADVPPPPLI